MTFEIFKKYAGHDGRLKFLGHDVELGAYEDVLSMEGWFAASLTVAGTAAALVAAPFMGLSPAISILQSGLTITALSFGGASMLRREFQNMSDGQPAPLTLDDLTPGNTYDAFGKTVSYLYTQLKGSDESVTEFNRTGYRAAFAAAATATASIMGAPYIGMLATPLIAVSAVKLGQQYIADRYHLEISRDDDGDIQYTPSPNKPKSPPTPF